MRQFTEKEKEVMRYIADVKSSGKDVSLLQVAKVIVDSLEYKAIYDPMPDVGYVDNATLLCHSDIKLVSFNNGDKIDSQAIYYDLLDFFLLLDYLVENAMIAKQEWSGNCSEVYKNEKCNDFTQDIVNGEKCLNFNMDSFSELNKYLITYKLDVILYPMPLLIELVNNDFKSVEQRRFELQLEDERAKHEQQMWWACLSFFIALLAAIISAVMPVIVELYVK
ncbi:MAG: hypothetical protein SNH79_04490 [Rikenellaceae bacterium]